MKINSVSPYFNINRPQKANIFRNSPISDIFVRCCTFKGDDKSFDAFSKWAKETGFIEKIPEIINNSENILGSGFEGTTYEIPNNDRWVLKEFKRSNLLLYHTDYPEITEIKDISPKLNIGQFVATIKVPLSKNMVQLVYILKKQNGKSCGVPYYLKDIVSDSTVTSHLTYLKALAGLPQCAYDKLIDDITYVTKQGYEFDCLNPYNFMLDMKNKQINFVDIADKVKDDKTQYANVLFSLLDAEYATNFNNSNRPEKVEADKLSIQICSKFMKAMLNKKSCFSDSTYFDKITGMPAFAKALGVKNRMKALEKLVELGLYY